jgi:hypothetical protein
MTNKQYHRRRRALARLTAHAEDSGKRSRRHAPTPAPAYLLAKGEERARLDDLVSRYENGELRTVHGKGSTRHRSTIAA